MRQWALVCGTAMWLTAAPALSHAQAAAPAPAAPSIQTKPHAEATSPDEAKAMAARAAERIRTLQREADTLAAQARTVFNDLRKLELDRAIAQQRVTEAEAALTAVTAQRDTAAIRVERIEAERVAETPGVAERLVSIYKRGRGGYAQLLLSSDDPRAFGRLTRGVAAIATLDQVRVEAHRRTLAAERTALADLENQRTQVALSQKAATKANQDLAKSVQARNNAIDAIDARRDLAAKYVAELQEAQATLQRRVGEFSTTVPELPFKPFRGALDWPAKGTLLTRFGPSRQGRFGTAIVRNGIEIKAAEGTPARAVHGGTVAYAEPFAGYGTLVIVDHGGGAFTMYGHLGEVRVGRGERVARNAIIGTVGLAPAGESALYFEVRVDGRPTDPLQWLRSSP
jgi:murein hydrolase activator